MNKRIGHHERERGIALLVTLLLITVLLGVGASILNITLRQYQFANIGLASEIAFQAANAGIECLLYHDYIDRDPLTPNSLESKFDIGQTRPSIRCMGQNDQVGGGGAITNGAPVRYRFSWGSPGLCTDVTIYKFYDVSDPVDMTDVLRKPGTCAAGVQCTVIRSYGYNVSCPSGGGSFPSRSVEREFVQRY